MDEPWLTILVYTCLLTTYLGFILASGAAMSHRRAWPWLVVAFAGLAATVVVFEL